MSTLALFDACKSIQASDAAERAGLTLKQRGTRYWSRCFMHEDKTESLVFYDDGRFYCFSCKASGDAVNLYELLYNLSATDAARRLMADYGLSVGDDEIKALKTDSVNRITARQLKDSAEMIRETRINELLTLRRRAEHDLKQRKGDDAFNLVAVISAVQDKIYRLELLDPADLVEWTAKGANIDEI